jgi:hypothetical protein
MAKGRPTRLARAVAHMREALATDDLTQVRDARHKFVVAWQAAPQAERAQYLRDGTVRPRAQRTRRTASRGTRAR